MKKIGVLTTFFSYNYGAALQAYAIIRALDKLGFSAQLINYNKKERSYYIPHAVKEENRTNCRNIRGLMKKAFNKLKKNPSKYFANTIRDGAFDGFVEQFLNVSNERITSTTAFLEALKKMDYDCFICGSDQVWNPIVHNFDPVYYLNFETGAKKVAYAPSVAYSKFDSEELAKIADNISSIDAISVREETTAMQLQPFVNKEIKTVIDPTFLLSPLDWLTLPSKEVLQPKYVLVYILNYNEFASNIPRLIEEYAKKNNCKIICLPYTKMNFSRDVDIQYRYDVAPNDFIHLLMNAELVVTNSFHATALSINLNRPFYVVSSHERNSDLQIRLADLLEKFNLQERCVFADSACLSDQEIDYKQTNEAVATYREAGIKFLIESIEAQDAEK